MKKFVLLLIVMSMMIVGCGSETSGSLTLAAPTYSNGVVTGKATYIPASGSSLANQKITFSWRTVSVASGTVDYPPSDSYTDSTGSASSDLILPSPRDTFIVYVKASTGDLTTGLQSVSAPQ